MKKLILAPFLLLLTACTTTTDVVEYRQVTVATPSTQVVSPVTWIEEEPIDVTTTTIEYY